jgi:hypothetical protein
MAYLMLAAFHAEPDLRQPVDGPDLRQPLEPAGATGPVGPGEAGPGEAGPGEAVSWEPTGSTVPPESPARPGSDPAAPPRD